MVRFIDAWVKATGKKLDDPIPDTWIPDGVTPHLTDVDPDAHVEDRTLSDPPSEPVVDSNLSDPPATDSPNTEEA